MFLKPVVTCNFAERVGHGFATDYRPALQANVYTSLLSLVDDMHAEIGELGPRDNIDLQSFIWVVGEYEEGDAPSFSTDDELAAPASSFAVSQ